jgi:hypothetical protein
MTTSRFDFSPARVQRAASEKAPLPDDGESFAGELTFFDADEWKIPGLNCWVTKMSLER